MESDLKGMQVMDPLSVKYADGHSLGGWLPGLSLSMLPTFDALMLALLLGMPLPRF